MAYESVQFQLVKDNVLRVYHPSLPEVPFTYLTTASSAGGTSLTVRDNTNFSASVGGDLLLLGEIGSEQTEIVYINGAITAGTALTTSTQIFAHPIGTSVRKIAFDKIEFYGNTSASSSGATQLNGSTTVNLDVSSPYTEYVMTATEASTYTFFGARFIRSVATTYNGSYSDFIATAGFDTDTVGFIIKQAFDACGEEIRPNGLLSKNWAYDQIFLGEQDVAKERKKWSWLQEFNYDAGNVALGSNSFSLPTNIDDKNTSRSIQGLRIGTGQNLTYMTKAEYDALFLNVSHTTVATNYLAGATTIVLTDSNDFQDSGSFNVYSSAIDGVAYPTTTRSPDTITGATGVDNAGTAADNVWQNEPQGKPLRFTVFEGTAYFDAVPDTTLNLVGSNIWLDYYKKVTRVNSDGDAITVPDPLCIQYWLETMLKKHKAGGKLDDDDSSWKNYLVKKARLIVNEVSGQGTYFVPTYAADL